VCVCGVYVCVCVCPCTTPVNKLLLKFFITVVIVVFILSCILRSHVPDRDLMPIEFDSMSLIAVVQKLVTGIISIA
jgi:hypothetical protein